MSRPIFFILCSICLLTQGCQSVAKSSQQSFTWSADKFANNKVSKYPYFFGGAVGGIAASPLILVTWPLSAIGFRNSEAESDNQPKSESDHDFDSDHSPGESQAQAEANAYQFWAGVAPSSYLGSALGSLLALPFFAIEWLFDDSESKPANSKLKEPDTRTNNRSNSQDTRGETSQGSEAGDQDWNDGDWNDNDWNDDDAWSGDSGSNFANGPPGGDRPPTPPLWRDLRETHSFEDGVSNRSLQRRLLEPWTPYQALPRK